MAIGDLRLTCLPETKVGLRIRKPPHEVFRALVDPAVTTRFWFSRSSGELRAGAELTWEWTMYGVCAQVVVKEFAQDRLVVFDWGSGAPDLWTTVELRFTPWVEDSTYVRIIETGFTGEADTVVQRVTDSTQGFTFLLSALKAWLEHGVVLRVVADAHPAGVEA